MHRDKFLIIKPTRCTDFSNLFLEWNSTCFVQFLCPSSGIFHCAQKQWCMLYRFADSCEQEQDGTTVPSWSCSHLSAHLYNIHHCLCVQWTTPDDGQGNCPKHVEFHSKNRFEKLVHLVGFITRIKNAISVLVNIYGIYDWSIVLANCVALISFFP
jgi:hypothetical protein